MDALGDESSRSHTRHELEDEIERVAREREVEGAVDFYTSNRNETLTGSGTRVGAGSIAGSLKVILPTFGHEY